MNLLSDLQLSSIGKVELLRTQLKKGHKISVLWEGEKSTNKSFSITGISSRILSLVLKKHSKPIQILKSLTTFNRIQLKDYNSRVCPSRAHVAYLSLDTSKHIVYVSVSYILILLRHGKLVTSYPGEFFLFYYEQVLC